MFGFGSRLWGIDGMETGSRVKSKVGSLNYMIPVKPNKVPLEMRMPLP